MAKVRLSIDRIRSCLQSEIVASNSSNCDVNEQQVDCAPEETCQPSCSAIFGKPCPRMCSERSCMCKSGFIRDDNLTCVPFSECKNGCALNMGISPLLILLIFLATRAISIDCGENEVNTSCAPIQKCQPSCEKPHGKRCPRMCSLTPCICKEGYIRASATNLTCVEVNQCADCK